MNLRVLMIDDVESDALIAVRALEEYGFRVEWTRVDNVAAFRESIARTACDVIIADYSSACSADRVLALLRERQIDIPCIVVSDVAVEDVAVKMMKLGACDFLSTSRLTQLGDAVERALQEKSIRRRISPPDREGPEPEEIHRAVLQASPEGFVLVDAAHRILDVNPAFSRLVGYSRGELLRMTLLELDPSGLSNVMTKLADTSHGADSVQMWTYYRPADGRRFDAEIRSFSLRIRGTIFTALFVRDVTMRQRIEANLRRETEFLDETQRMAHVGHWEWNLSDNTWVCSNALYRICGLDPDHHALTFERYLDAIHPDDRDAFEAKCHAALAADASFVMEKRIRRPDGSERILVCRGHVRREGGSEPAALRVVCMDITEQRQIELQLRRAQRLATLGTLTAGIAHEINNPMSAAWVAAETARMAKDQPDKKNMIDESLDAIAHSVKRCQAIIQSMLRFARRDASVKSSIDLNQVVQGALQITQHFISYHRAMLHAELADHLSPVWGNAIELEQVIVNLIRNAVQSRDGARVTVRTMPSASGVALRVTDNGRGIPREHIERIFDPYFTRQEAASGTGLGLTISHAIVRDHGGTIHVESREGQGTTFTVNLPVKPPDVPTQVSLFDTEDTDPS